MKVAFLKSPLWLTLFGLMFFMTGGQNENGPLTLQINSANAATDKAEVKELKLLHFGPDGNVQKATQVTAMFNQPMVALGDYKNVSPGAMKISPELAGTFHWLNQYTLAFTPEKTMLGSLNLKVSIAPGLKSLSGAELKNGQEITVALPRIKVAAFDSIDNNLADQKSPKAVNLMPAFRLTFNQEIDFGSLKQKITCVYPGGTAPVEIKAVTNGDKISKKAADVLVTKQLPPNTEYQIMVASGVKSLAGPLPSEEFDALSSQTYGPLTASVDIYDNALDPEYGLSVSFSNPVVVKEALKHLNINNGYDVKSLLSAHEEEGAEEEAPETTTYLYLPGGFKPNTSYTISFDDKLTDVYGQTLSGNKTASFETTAYSRLVTLDGSLGIMETGTEPKLPLKARSLDEVQVSGYALNPEQAIKFMVAARLYPDYFNDEDGFKALSDIKPVSQTLKVPGGGYNGTVIVPLDLKNLFGDKLTGNLLYVRAPWNEGGKRNYARTASTVVQVTDIGLAVKAGPSSSLAWVTNMPKGQAWPGVALEVRSQTGAVLWKGQSDANGLAEFPGLADAAFKNADKFFMVAQAEGQMAIWDITWDNGLEAWRWNISTDSISGITVPDYWLLSALPLYKPGEKVKFKIIAREKQGDQLNTVAAQTISITINDGRGRPVKNVDLPVNKNFGTAVYEFDIPEGAALGTWTVVLNDPEKESSNMIGTFMVMTYRAPAFEIKVGELPEKAVSGSNVSIKAKADYHFGSPVAGQPASYSISAGRTDITLPGLADFTLVNYFSQDETYDDSGYGYQEPSVIVASDETKLNKDGGLTVPISLTTPADKQPFPRSYETSITVEDVDRRKVSTSASFTVHPADIYVGLKGAGFMTVAEQPMQLKVVAADLNGAMLEDRKVTATLYRRTWQSVRRKSPGSVYEYVSKTVDEKISTTEVTTGKLPVDFEVTPPKPGYYWVLAEVKDEKGRLNQSSYDFYASGNGAVGWQMSNDDRLTLVTDKREYKPGDTAKVLVQSPFDQGEGLLTVERAGVRQSRTFKIENQTPTLEIPLTEDDSPNVFVSVLLTRGRIAEKPDKNGVDLGKPAVRMGYAELKIPSKKDLLTVEVTPSAAEVKAGEEVTVEVTVKDDKGQPVKDAEVALIAVDAAVVQLGGDSPYYPDRQFLRDFPLMVSTADNLISLIGRRNWGIKGANPGGGGGMDMASALMSDKVRKLFSALAHFEPQVALNDQGRATVKIKMPENLTTFKVYAVATGQGRKTGTGVNSVLVSKDLLVRPALPNYAGVRDTFSAAVVVSNRGKKSGEATVTLEGENFTFLEGKEPKKVAVAPGESHEVSFKVRAGAEEKAKFLFRVKMDEDSDAAEFVIPVSPPNQLTTQASYELIKPGDTETDLAIQPGTDMKRGGLEIEFSPSLVGVLSEPFDWLLSYPHGCVEQATSKAYANLVWLNMKERLNSSPEKEKKARENVAAHLERLAGWENGGGFNYWPSDQNWSTRSVYLSAHVLDFVLSAQEAGFEIPAQGLISRISGFLQNSLSEDYNWPKWYSKEAIRSTKTYAVAMLSRAGENVASSIEVLYQERKQMGLFELTNLLRAINFQPKGSGQAGQMAEIILMIPKHARLTAGQIQFVEDKPTPEIWSSSIRTSAMTLTALCEAAPHNEMIPGLVRWLVDASRNGHFGTTQNNISVLYALNTYVKVMEPTTPNITVTALLGDSPMAKATFKSFKDAPVSGNAGLEAVPQGTPKVVYKATGEGQVWSALKIKSAPAKPDFSAETSGGYMLSRTFAVVKPKAGEPGAEKFKRGDVVRVSVTIMVPEARHNTVLQDRVPAGFEPINFNLGDADRSLTSLVSDDTRDGDDDDVYYRSRYWYNHQEIWPDKVAVYADYLSAGVYTFSYLAQAVTPGMYLTPGPQAEEMYAPETYGRAAGQIIEIE